MARQRHTMTRVRWTVLALGTAALALAFVVSDDITVRFTAAFAYGLGALILGASERIIASTRTHPQTRLADARQGRAIDR